MYAEPIMVYAQHVQLKSKALAIRTLTALRKVRVRRGVLDGAVQVGGLTLALAGLAMLVNIPVAMIVGGVLLVVAIERQ